MYINADTVPNHPLSGSGKQIQKLIRDTVGDIYRDIWLKRNSWK